MLSVKANEFVWAQKYRPQNVAECILPTYLRKELTNLVEKQQIPNVIFAGPPGIGKTTAAIAMVTELGGEFLMINGSMSGNIDTLRVDIKNYASGVSFSGKRKFIILDEADYLNANSTQPALRNFMEEYSRNVTFFLTCNYINKIIEPLQGRCSVIEFKIPNAEKPALAGAFFKRIQEILKLQEVEYDQKVLATIVTKYFPDFRKTLNELQRMASSGSIDVGMLTQSSSEQMDQLGAILKAKKFTEMRKWVAENATNSSSFYRDLYEMVLRKVSDSTVPPIIISIADYQYRDAFAVDKEINIVALLTEVMINAEWK